MNKRKAVQILEEAQRAKQEWQNTHQTPEQKPEADNPVIPTTPANDERHEVHRAMFEKSVGIVWLLPLSLLVIPWIVYASHPIPIIGWVMISVCIGIPVLRFCYVKIACRLQYASFRHWRQELPFQLEGWENVVDHPDFTRPISWRLQASFIICSSSNAEQIETLLYLFCRQANRCFYPSAFVISGFAGDPRKKWIVQGNQAEGSCNCQVTRAIHDFLRYKLTPLAQQLEITKVSLVAEPKAYSIPFEEVD